MPKRRAPTTTKAPGGQFHPSTKWFPSKSISRMNAVINAGVFQRLLRRPPPSFVLPATVSSAFMFAFIGVPSFVLQSELRCKASQALKQHIRRWSAGGAQVAPDRPLALLVLALYARQARHNGRTERRGRLPPNQ